MCIYRSIPRASSWYSKSESSQYHRPRSPASRTLIQTRLLYHVPWDTFGNNIPVPGWWPYSPLRCHNGHDSVSNHQSHNCFLNRLFRHRSKKTSKLCVTGLCVGNSPGTGELPAQMACNAEKVSIWWRHHERQLSCCYSGIPWTGGGKLSSAVFARPGLVNGQSPERQHPYICFNMSFPISNHSLYM